MEEPKKIKKYKLSRSEESRAEEPAKPKVEPKEAKQSLTLGKPHSDETYIPSGEGHDNDVEDYLEEAYCADKETNRLKQRRQKIQLIGVLLGLVTLSVVLLFGYAHALKQWPMLEPKTWYLPFVLSALLSLYMIVRGYLYLKHSRSVALFSFGIAAAIALAIWNAEVLRVTAQADVYSPSNIFWQPENVHEMLIAYEVNRARGLPPTVQPYKSAPLEQYKAEFRAIPRTEWKDYFSAYLSADELEKVTIMNIDDTMIRVSGRMQEARAAVWDEFLELYNSPTLGFRLQKLGVSPYKLLLGNI